MHIERVTTVELAAALRIYREAEATLCKFHGDKVEFYRPTQKSLEIFQMSHQD